MAKKNPAAEVAPVVLPASNFDYGIYTRSVNKICTGNGVELLGDMARDAIAADEKVTISPYALLGLITSWQSLQQETINMMIAEGIKPAKAQELVLRAISIDGIKERIADEKAQQAIEREASRPAKKGRGR